MDILDSPNSVPFYKNSVEEYDRFEEHEYLTEKERKDLVKLVTLRIRKYISLNEYYMKLSEFWKESGDEEFANEILLKIKD